MPKIRTIKPGFFTDSDIAELKPLARLAFIGLWCHADKAGRLKDKPRELKIEILPYDEIDMDIILNELSERFIIRYEVKGEKLIQIKGFLEHQRPHPHENPSKLPVVPVKCNGKTRKDTASHGKKLNLISKTLDKDVIDTEEIDKDELSQKALATPKERTPIQKVVGAYKIAKGLDRDDKVWDKANFARCAKSAKSILEALPLEKAISYIIIKADEFKSKGLDFTLETIVRHAHDQKGELNVKLDDGENTQDALVSDPVSEPERLDGPTQERRTGFDELASGVLRSLPHIGNDES